MVVEAHHAEACSCISEANDEAEWGDKERPVEACDDDEQKQDDEHRGAMQQSLAVLGGIFARFANGTKHGASHHHEQEREPEKCHARSAEVLDSRQDVVPKLEERRMVAHAVAQSDNGTESPETCPTALAREEQAEEPEEREERACVVVVQLETVVAPVERAAHVSGLAHLVVFVHGHIDKGTALERIRICILFINIDADESRNEHLGHFFLVERPADGVTVIGVVAFATHGLRRSVEVRWNNLEAAEGKPESERCSGKPDAFTAGGKRIAVECSFVKRVEPGAPEEQVSELQVASENHPRDAERKDNEVGETSVADNLADGEECQGRDGEYHHLSVMTAVDVGEVFGRECVEESEKRTPPFVAG